MSGPDKPMWCGDELANAGGLPIRGPIRCQMVRGHDGPHLFRGRLDIGGAEVEITWEYGSDNRGSEEAQP